MPKTAQNISAVVCSHTDYSDTSLVIALYSRELGKIHALARGVKKKRADMGRLELLQEVKIQVIEPRAGGSRLFLVPGSGVALEKTFCGLRANIAAFAACTYASELVMSLLPFEEPDEEVYDLFLAFLAFADNHSANLRPPLMSFELRLLGRCGFGVEARGGKTVGQALDFLASADFEAAAEADIDSALENKIEGIIRSALDFHLEKTLKSFSFMKETICGQRKQRQKN